MGRKRGNNEGSIYKRADGRWAGAVSLSNGKRKTIYGRTRAEVATKLAATIRDRDKGVPQVAEQVRVAGYLERWLRESVQTTTRPATHDSYRRIVTHHIVPAIGNLRLARLTPADLSQLYRAILDKGLSPRMAQLTHAVMHRALVQAMRWGLVAVNVADMVDPPKVTRFESHPLTPEEAARFLKVAQDDRLYALYALLVAGGLRIGEALGARWADLDLERGVLAVRQSVARLSGRWVFSAPKSGKARSVALPTFVVEALKQHRLRQVEERLQAPAWEDHDLIFPNGVGRPMERQNLLRRSYWPLLDRAKLPRVRLHDLRHTAATLLLSQGTHPKVVQERLGHSTIAITMDTYSHVMPQMQAAAAKQLDSLLSPVAVNVAVKPGEGNEKRPHAGPVRA